MATSATPGRSSRLITSPTTEISGCPATVSCGVTLIRPARSCSAPAGVGQRVGDGGAATPAVHRTVPGVVPRRARRRRPRTVQPAGVHVGDDRVHVQSRHPRRRAPRPPCGTARPEGRQRLVAAVEEQDPGVAGVDAPVLAVERVRRELPDLAGELDAGRSGTDQGEGEPLASLVGRRRGCAISKAPKTRARISRASASVFIPGACSANSSWPK